MIIFQKVGNWGREQEEMYGVRYSVEEGKEQERKKRRIRWDIAETKMMQPKEKPCCSNGNPVDGALNGSRKTEDPLSEQQALCIPYESVHILQTDFVQNIFILF